MAENLSDLSKLLNTNQCLDCDLSNAGLVMTNLAGAKLMGANLAGANLSRANLSGVDLTGANLMGASLYGANLTGANLMGANLNSTDLRNAYVVNANFTGADLKTAYVQGAVGIPENAADAGQFYLWGLEEDQKGNYKAAFSHYNQAINLDPEFAPAYLAKAVISSRMGKTVKAIEDGEKAGELFASQENKEGAQLSARFVEIVKVRAEMEDSENQGSPQFVQIVNSIAPLLLRFILP
jgi:uncharacterized protein YjbI with pentapeptide repeats